jgi:hypothetical protein
MPMGSARIEREQAMSRCTDADWRGLRHWLRSEHLKQLCRMGLAGPVPSFPVLSWPWWLLLLLLLLLRCCGRDERHISSPLSVV